MFIIEKIKEYPKLAALLLAIITGLVGFFIGMLNQPPPVTITKVNEKEKIVYVDKVTTQTKKRDVHVTIKKPDGTTITRVENETSDAKVVDKTKESEKSQSTTLVTAAKHKYSLGVSYGQPLFPATGFDVKNFSASFGVRLAETNLFLTFGGKFDKTLLVGLVYEF
jgi:hypothetical protein